MASEGYGDDSGWVGGRADRRKVFFVTAGHGWLVHLWQADWGECFWCSSQEMGYPGSLSQSLMRASTILESWRFSMAQFSPALDLCMAHSSLGVGGRANFPRRAPPIRPLNLPLNLPVPPQ